MSGTENLIPGGSPSPASRSLASKMKSVACRKCHARKVRCPGGQPCRSCVQLNCEAECTYPKRDRQVKVSQNYIERLLRENQQLRHDSRGRSEESALAGPVAPDDARPYTPSPGDPSQNPLLDDEPWFLPIKSSNLPILIGEVADAAFATRFRQLLTHDTLNHIPRISYPSNDQISELAQAGYSRPSSTHARVLIRVALKSFEGSFHIVQNSHVWELLERFLHGHQPYDSLSKCKLMALFALGELYSSRGPAQETMIPGLAYFSHASRAHGLLQERPCVETVEISLLLCLYALCINRRHSAYFLASSAIRHCVVMGLHFNLPPAHFPDPDTREHLNRIWWTAYVMDYTVSSISSQIVSVPDDEIFADPPSTITTPNTRKTDFPHTQCLLARISLAKITRGVIKSIYGRGRVHESFLQRAQQSLRDLKQWLEDLPDDLRMDSEPPQSKPATVRSLHLAFNQSMIMATRPVLLHTLRMHKEANGATPKTSDQIISTAVQTIAEACTRCARHSYATLVDTWVEGSFRTFDYFSTQYLFSAATVLAMSSLISGSSGSNDREDFEYAGQLLRSLRDSGSFAATEFCRHIDAMNTDINFFLPREPLVYAEPHSTAALGYPNQSAFTVQSPQLMTSSMALAEPSLEAFLQSDQDLSQVDIFLGDAQLGGLYWTDQQSDAHID